MNKTTDSIILTESGTVARQNLNGYSWFVVWVWNQRKISVCLDKNVYKFCSLWMWEHIKYYCWKKMRIFVWLDIGRVGYDCSWPLGGIILECGSRRSWLQGDITSLSKVKRVLLTATQLYYSFGGVQRLLSSVTSHR